jgi:phage repressor protein C with HTH and peptisase S24 domain
MIRVRVVNIIRVYTLWETLHMSEMGERLKRAREAAGYPSARAAATRKDWKVSTYAAHENGQNEFGPDEAQKYAKAFKVKAGYLLTGEGESDTSEQVRVPLGGEFAPDTDGGDIPLTELDRPFPDALPQMVGRIGGGSTGAVITIDVGEMQTREEVGEWWRIPPVVLRGLARSDVAKTVGFAMDGDSMEPTIQRTDIVFIDTGRQKIEPDGIWALDYGLGRTLKRVSVERVDGNLRFVLKSDNKAYPDQSFGPEEVTIFGRYVGRFSVF